jgi:hypothetical protein
MPKQMSDQEAFREGRDLVRSYQQLHELCLKLLHALEERPIGSKAVAADAREQLGLPPREPSPSMEEVMGLPPRTQEEQLEAMRKQWRESIRKDMEA